MVGVVQLLRTPICGTGGRGFNSRRPPQQHLAIADFVSRRTSTSAVSVAGRASRLAEAAERTAPAGEAWAGEGRVARLPTARSFAPDDRERRTPRRRRRRA